jgi:transposase
MTDNKAFVGLDVHKQTISVALVEASAGAEVRFCGTIANTPAGLRTLCRKMSRDGQQLHFCYEAGPCGRASLRGGGAGADPAQGRDKVKTDRRAAMMLAQTLRAGQLIAVWVPNQAHETRDLVRLRTQIVASHRRPCTPRAA